MKVTSIINKKVMLGGGLLAATLLCSATTAVVVATGTGSDYVNDSGQIRSCRDNSSGNVRILDNNTENCNSDEAKVSWTQQGGPVVHDANGQVIGNMIDSRKGDESPLTIYSPTLKRVIPINYSQAGHYAITPAGAGGLIYFSSDDCTGQPYMYDDHRLGVKTELLRTGDSSYGVVEDNTSAQTISYGSAAQYSLDSDSFNCIDLENYEDAGYTIEPVSLPFTTPLAGPFKF